MSSSKAEVVQPEYGAGAIQVLKGLEAVRKRPGMYIDDTGKKGLHHLVWEIVDNSVDEALAGHCNEITVTLQDDGSVSVSDNGRGIPVDIHPEEGVAAATLVFTVLHAGGKFGGGSYKESGGLHGVGASVVNALSQWLSVTINRNGGVYRQQFKQGTAIKPMARIGDMEPGQVMGTTVRFKPDPEMFADALEEQGSLDFDYALIARRLKTTAMLTSGLRINFIKGERQESFYSGWFIAP